jgi:hypothetical protein
VTIEKTTLNTKSATMHKGLYYLVANLSYREARDSVAHSKSNSVVERWVMPAAGSFLGSEGVTSEIR